MYTESWAEPQIPAAHQKLSQSGGVEAINRQNGGVDGAAVPEHQLHPARPPRPRRSRCGTSAVRSRQSQQRRARNGIGGDRPAVFQRHGEISTLVSYRPNRPVDPSPTGSHGGAVRREIFCIEVYHGAEPLRAGIAAVQAKAEALRPAEFAMKSRPFGDKVQQSVKGGQRRTRCLMKAQKVARPKESRLSPPATPGPSPSTPARPPNSIITSTSARR